MSQNSARVVSSSSEIKKLSSSINEATSTLDDLASEKAKVSPVKKPRNSHFIKQSDVQDIIRLMNNEMSLDGINNSNANPANTASLNEKDAENSEKCSSNDTGFDEVNTKTSPSVSVDETNSNQNTNSKNENSDYCSQTTEKDSSSSSLKNEKFLISEQSEKIMDFAEKLTQDLIETDANTEKEDNSYSKVSDEEGLADKNVPEPYDEDEMGHDEQAEDYDDDDIENEEDFVELDHELDEFIQRALDFGANALDISKRGLTKLPKSLYQLVDLQVNLGILLTRGNNELDNFQNVFYDDCKKRLIVKYDVIQKIIFSFIRKLAFYFILN